MNESENNGQAKGFKGLRSLGPKPGETSERPSAPERRVEAPKLPAAWSQQTDGHQQSSQPQSTTAPSPWRGWAVGLGVLAAIVLFFMWLVNQSPSKRAYPPPSIANQQQPSDANAGPIVTPPPPSNGPAITKPPVGSNLVFTSPQIRFCVFEDIRIKGAERVVDNYDQWSVDTFNAMVEDFNSRCGSFRYRSGALAPIEREAEGFRAELENEGRARMRGNPVRESTSDSTEIMGIEDDEPVAGADLPTEFPEKPEFQQVPLQPVATDDSAMESSSYDPESSSYSDQESLRQESLSYDERSSVELACITVKSRGPAAYGGCVSDQLRRLADAPRTPSTAGLSYDEKSAIELACITTKSRGPAEYNRCLVGQIDALADAPRQPSLAGLSYNEKSAIELACITKKSQGAATYNRCQTDQLNALAGGPREPSFAGLSYDEKSSIELACITRKSSGAAGYNRCLVDQLSQLDGAPRSPNMSGLSYQDRSSVELACISTKASGAASYNRCLTRQLNSIGR